MIQRFIILALLWAVPFASVRAQAGKPAQDVAKMIQTASDALLDRSASRDQIQEALIRLLDAADQALPQSPSASEARSNLKAARAGLQGSSMLSEQTRQRLALAYRALNGGRDFEFPKVDSIEKARAYIQDLATASVARIKTGQGDQVPKMLVECVIMVVTPINR